MTNTLDKEKIEQSQKSKEWKCSKCDHMLANLANDSIVIFYKEGRECYVTFDQMNMNCPKCDSLEVKESPLLYAAIKTIIEKPNNDREIDFWHLNPIEELLAKIRMKAWGIVDRAKFAKTFPDDTVILPNKEKSLFISSLSENQRKAYKIMCDTFQSDIEDSEMTNAIQERLKVPASEADHLHHVVLEKLREFRSKNSERFIHN